MLFDVIVLLFIGLVLVVVSRNGVKMCDNAFMVAYNIMTEAMTDMHVHYIRK